MNDFKIGDNIEEQTPEQLTIKRNKSRKFAVIIVVIIILAFAVIALVIWFIYRYKVKRRANDEKS